VKIREGRKAGVPEPLRERQRRRAVAAVPRIGLPRSSPRHAHRCLTERREGTKRSRARPARKWRWAIVVIWANYPLPLPMATRTVSSTCERLPTLVAPILRLPRSFRAGQQGCGRSASWDSVRQRTLLAARSGFGWVDRQLSGQCSWIGCFVLHSLSPLRKRRRDVRAAFSFGRLGPQGTGMLWGHSLEGVKVLPRLLANWSYPSPLRRSNDVLGAPSVPPGTRRHANRRFPSLPPLPAG
jgi:hypothetical protein